MSLAAKPFTFQSWTPAPADPVKDSLKKFGVTYEEEVKTFKTLIAYLKKHAEENKDGVISLDLFARVGEQKLCQTQDSKVTEEPLKNAVNPELVDREVKEFIEGMTKMKKYGSQNKGGHKGYNNHGEGNDFAKGTANKGKYNN